MREVLEDLTATFTCDINVSITRYIIEKDFFVCNHLHGRKSTKVQRGTHRVILEFLANHRAGFPPNVTKGNRRGVIT